MKLTEKVIALYEERLKLDHIELIKSFLQPFRDKNSEYHNLGQAVAYLITRKLHPNTAYYLNRVSEKEANNRLDKLKKGFKKVSQKDIPDIASWVESVLFDATPDAEHEKEQYKDYWKLVMKGSAPNAKNIERHLGSDKEMVKLVKELSKKYVVGMDGDSIVAPLNGGKFDVTHTDGKDFYMSIEKFKGGSKMEHTDYAGVIKIFTKNGILKNDKEWK